MWDKHRTTVEMATEAVNDPDVVAFIPDPKSRSGKSSRFIGFSPTADRVLVVIVVGHEDRQYGANCWPANLTDQRTYLERNDQ
ncbi:MAG: transposase [Mycobacterium sp.]|nr:MAG: transposase [Mycobacterium sp.]